MLSWIPDTDRTPQTETSMETVAQKGKKMRNVVKLHKRAVELHTPRIPMTACQIHTGIVDAFKSKRWLFDFTHQQVAKMLSDLAWYGRIQSKTILYRDGRTPKIMYWKGIDYDWGRDL